MRFIGPNASLIAVAVLYAIGGALHAHHLDPHARTFVSNGGDGTVSVVDARTDQVIATYPVGGRAGKVRPSADGQTLYVAVHGRDGGAPRGDSVVEIDVASGRILRRYPAGNGTPPAPALSR